MIVPQKLLKLRVSDNELVEIGWINEYDRNCFHRPLKVVLKSEADNSKYNSYYPDVFTTKDEDELIVRKHVFSFSSQIYVRTNEVVGWTSNHSIYHWYYDDYIDSVKNYW